MERRPAWTCVVVLAAAGAVLAGDGAPPSPNVLRARHELLQALGPPPAPDAAERAAEADAARAGLERTASVDVRLRLVGVLGVPLAGVTVRALHEGFDVAAAPTATDSAGRAIVRLPRGAWRLDLARTDVGAGGCVFAQVRVDADPAVERRVDLGERRTVRFRRRGGEVETPRAVTLSAPDFSFHADLPPGDGAFDVFTAPGTPLLLQALEPPGEQPGYVLRRDVGPGATTIVIDDEEATRFAFVGDADREVAATVRSVDALPFDLAFSTSRRREVALSGFAQAAVSLSVRRGVASYAFYALPFALDGAARTFTGEPPFETAVGCRHNTFAKYGARRDTVSMRAFLRDPNGLVLRGSSKPSAFEVDWEETLDGKTRASGTMSTWYYARTPPLPAKDVGRLGYRLHVRGPGWDHAATCAPHGQDEQVVAGKVRVRTYPEFAPNVRLWAACVNDAVRAYEDTSAARRPWIDVSLFSEMPPGLGGWGGVRGDGVGFCYLPESEVFGFAGPYFSNKTLFHELGHTQGYWHDTAAKKRVMQQAGRRASRRYAAIRAGMERVPEGNRFLPALEALSRGAAGDPGAGDPDADDDEPSKADDSPKTDDGDEPEIDLETTGEDELLAWYLRCTHGVAADRLRRTSAAAWRWSLVLGGFSDDEIEAAVYSRAAGEPLAWLARLRGLAASDRRVAAAVEAIASDAGLVSAAARAAASSRWLERDLAAEPDLAVAKTTLLAEVGLRETRVAGLRGVAAACIARGDRDRGRATLVEALAEARRGARALFEDALTACATSWAGR